MRVAAAYLGALPVTETNCVTKPFQPENCPNCHPTKICGLHSSEGIEAFVRLLKTFSNLIIFSQWKNDQFQRNFRSKLKFWNFSNFTIGYLIFFCVSTLTLNFSETGHFSIMKKLWDLKKLFSNLEPEGQGQGIIMGVTRLLLLGLFYTIQTKGDQTLCTRVY